MGNLLLSSILSTLFYQNRPSHHMIRKIFSIQFDSDIIKKIKSNVEQNFNYLGCDKHSNADIRELKLKIIKTPLNRFI